MRYFALLLLLFAHEAHACQRCGLFGNRCRFVSRPVVQQHVVSQPVAVAPVATYQSPDVFVVQNNYPQPNGTIGLLAQQGTSVYGYQAAAAAYFVNPAETLRQAAELAKAASATASIGLTGYNETARTQLTLQAAIAEPLAKGQAAAQVLGAAGLSAPSSQSQSFALRISQDSAGRWQVTQADPAQVSATVHAEINEHSTPTVPARPVNGASVLAAKCARCHGLNLTEPKGGMFLDAGHPLDCATVVKAIKQVKSNKMPPDGGLTDQEKGLLLDELLSLERDGS